MAIFRLPPPLAPTFHALQPALIPAATAPSGGFLVGVGAGRGKFNGAAPGLVSAQGFGIGQGRGIFLGAQAGLALGTPSGFGPGIGNANFFGYSVGLGITGTPPPAVPGTPFDPALSEMALDAWERCGIQAGQITVTHFNSMRRSMNFVLSRWSNLGIHLWKVDLVSQALVPGTATYTVDPSVLDVLDSYIRQGNGTGNGPTDLVITPMSRNVYAALPKKNTPGRPTQFWFDRTVAPTVTMWPVPDDATYTFNYYVFRQIMNMSPVSGNRSQLPFRFLEAYTASLAAHLSMKWAPDRAQALMGYAGQAFEEAQEEDREKVVSNISPNFDAYFH